MCKFVILSVSEISIRILSEILFFKRANFAKICVATQKVKITLNLWIATNLHAHALQILAMTKPLPY